jgi:FtsP/CotA-like multicopper oxidase with cupredoxin domain
MRRRAFLAAGAGSLIAWRLGAAPGVAARRLPLREVRVLRAERADPVSGRCRYVADGIASPVFAAGAGDAVDLVVENALPQPTTVHFHGLTLPEDADGAGFDPIAPGARKRVRFEVRNRAALYWLHPHPHGFTAEQVYSGLVAPLVVADAEDDALDAALALAPGNRLALALADARVAGGQWRPYAPSAHDCLHGWLGNAFPQREIRVSSGWLRLQIVNACNARGLLLAFRDGDALVPFHLLGTDGGLLAAPRQVERVFLHGAERVDIAVDMTGKALTAVSLAFDPRHHAHGGHPGHKHPARASYPPLAAEAICSDAPPDEVPADGAPMKLFELKVVGTAKAVPALPKHLSFLRDPFDAAGVPVRRIRLDFDERGFLIDERAYRLDEPGYAVKRGSREIWEVKNSPVSMPHAMHLHGFGFRVLRRQGTFGPARRLATEPGGRLPTDLGVKDTVTVWPNETVWLAVDFSLPESFRGPQRYMFHCHNLEHEDGMMMRNVTVT